MEQKINIYQLLARHFGNTNCNNKPAGSIKENGCGKLNDITKMSIQKLKKAGYSHLWLTGVIEHATMTSYSQFGILDYPNDIIKGRAGSPYAISDYYDIAPDLAEDIPNRMQEFENLINRTHKEGLKAIIDFVPNHVARAYQSDAKPKGIKDFGENDMTNHHFNIQNDFYYFPNEPFVYPNDITPLGQGNDYTFKNNYEEFPAKATGNDCFSPQPSIHDWYETVKLNYGIDYLNQKSEHFDPKPSVWLKMKDILLYWAQKGVDGFRCDMAQMVPVQFWNWVISEVKKQFPEVIFIAEIYEEHHYKLFLEYGNFDFLYDKVGLYDTLKDVSTRNVSANAITGIWQRHEEIQDQMLDFLENHDEHRIASPEFAKEGYKAKSAALVSATMNNGPFMMYAGQEFGEPALNTMGFSGNDGRTSIFDYCGVPSMARWNNNGKFDLKKLKPAEKDLKKFYDELLNFTISNKTFAQGKFFDLQYFNYDNPYYADHEIYSFLRFDEKNIFLIVANFRNYTQSIRLKIPELALNMAETLPSKAFKIKSCLGNFENHKIITDSLVQEGINIKLPPYDGVILLISQA